VQESVFDVQISVSIGVTLKFIVSSSVAVDFVLPFGSIQGISVKVVLPDEVVLCHGKVDAR
jgi:hypothetical protein